MSNKCTMAIHEFSSYNKFNSYDKITFMIHVAENEFSDAVVRTLMHPKIAIVNFKNIYNEDCTVGFGVIFFLMKRKILFIRCI